MLAFVVSGSSGSVQIIPKPTLDEPGFALIRVLRAGVCNTDLEILQGYMGFQGVLGHEFVGIVEDVFDKDSTSIEWIGRRVCGDINVGCNVCGICLNKANSHGPCQMSRNHCPHRTVLGILNRNGTMAEYLTLPIRNLHVVPSDVSDEVAVFAEPLAAACRIIEQGLILETDKVAILGDGKLGLMIAEVLGRAYGNNVTIFGKHPQKLDMVKASGVDCRLVDEAKDAKNGSVTAEHAAKYDVVVEATGSPAGLTLASELCRPMGTLVLKSTCAAGEPFNAAPFVIHELKIVGSRCGPIDKALELLELKDDTKPLNVEKYITKVFPLTQADEGIKFAAERSTMKVQIICSREEAGESDHSK